jgi:kynurenine formamidase
LKFNRKKVTSFSSVIEILMRKFGLFFLVIFLSVLVGLFVSPTHSRVEPALWQVYQQSFKQAKYVDLTHTIAPSIPIWEGFSSPTFSATVNPKTGKSYTYAADGFEATHYDLSTDQLGTQLDPPAHWEPYYPAIDELPATYAIRPLVVIPIQDKVARDRNYHLQLEDILAWEKKHGKIPEGSVVFVRSDWSKEWSNPDLAKRKKFPGVSLEALKFLHLKRKILFTDTNRSIQTVRQHLKEKPGSCIMVILRLREWLI